MPVSGCFGEGAPDAFERVAVMLFSSRLSVPKHLADYYLLGLDPFNTFLKRPANFFLTRSFIANSFTPKTRAWFSLTRVLKPVQRMIGRSGRICNIILAKFSPVIPGMV